MKSVKRIQESVAKETVLYSTCHVSNWLLCALYRYGKIISTKAILDPQTNKCKGKTAISDCHHVCHSPACLVTCLPQTHTHHQEASATIHWTCQNSPDTVNDLFSSPTVVTAPYLFSRQYSPMTASIMQRTCWSHPEIKNSVYCISINFCSHKTSTPHTHRIINGWSHKNGLDNFCGKNHQHDGVH